MWGKSRPEQCFCWQQFTPFMQCEGLLGRAGTISCSTLLKQLWNISIVVIFSVRQGVATLSSIKSIPSLSCFNPTRRLLMKSVMNYSLQKLYTHSYSIGLFFVVPSSCAFFVFYPLCAVNAVSLRPSLKPTSRLWTWFVSFSLLLRK